MQYSRQSVQFWIIFESFRNIILNIIQKIIYEFYVINNFRNISKDCWGNILLFIEIIFML